MRLTKKNKELLFDYLRNTIGLHKESDESLLLRLKSRSRMQIPGSTCPACGAREMLIYKVDDRNPHDYFVSCSCYPNCPHARVVAWRGMGKRPVFEEYTRPATLIEVRKTPHFWEFTLLKIEGGGYRLS